MTVGQVGVLAALLLAMEVVTTPSASGAQATGSVDPAVLPPGDAVTPAIDCAEGARPVVVLPGADGTVTDTAAQWATVTESLRTSGACPLVFQGGVVDGKRWAGNIPDGAAQLAVFVESVQAATGSDTVDLVAHSAGTVVSNYYLKVLHGSPNVSHAVFLAPESRDCDGAGFLASLGIHDAPVTPVQVLTAFPFLAPVLGHLSPDLAVALQLAPGSDVYTAVFADGTPITQPGVTYSVLATADDAIATPAGVCSFIDEPGVTNDLFEDLYPGAPAVDHSSLRSSPDTASWVVAQLAR